MKSLSLEKQNKKAFWKTKRVYLFVSYFREFIVVLKSSRSHLIYPLQFFRVLPLRKCRRYGYTSCSSAYLSNVTWRSNIPFLLLLIFVLYPETEWSPLVIVLSGSSHFLLWCFLDCFQSCCFAECSSLIASFLLL